MSVARIPSHRVAKQIPHRSSNLTVNGKTPGVSFDDVLVAKLLMYKIGGIFLLKLSILAHQAKELMRNRGVISSQGTTYSFFSAVSKRLPAETFFRFLV